MKAFFTGMLTAQGLDSGEKVLPLWIAKFAANTAEFIWKNLDLKSRPPVAPLMIRLMGNEFSVSARNPGGGFLNGSQAQEESVARATGLYPCLLKGEGYYIANRAIETCLYTDHMIYAPGVPVIKDEEGDLLNEAVNCSVLTAPAVNTGVVLRNEPENIPQVEPMMSRRIAMVLAVCAQQKHETLILGAWGCGVFRNDPQVIARLFHEHLNGKFKNRFKKVVFSIYAKDSRFIQPFQEYFG